MMMSREEGQATRNKGEVNFSDMVWFSQGFLRVAAAMMYNFAIDCPLGV